MKNLEEKLRTKTPTAIYAMASGILTDMLFEFLAESTYIGRYDAGRIEVVADGKYPPLQVILLAMGVFFLIWVTLGIVVPKLLNVIYRLSFKSIKKHRRTDVLQTYSSVRNNVVDIEDMLSMTEFDNQCLNTFIFVDLVKAIKKLADVFVAANGNPRLFQRSFFRTGKVMDDIDRYVSPYEFRALVVELERLVNWVYERCSHENSIEGDYRNALERLRTLKKMHRIDDDCQPVPHPPHN